MSKRGGKFGPVKRQHGRVEGLDKLLDNIVQQCPHVSKIVPGRMGRKRGKTPASFRIQYPTTAPDGSRPTGLKCIYTKAGSWQEVFLVCDDVERASDWLEKHIQAKRSASSDPPPASENEH